MRKKIFIIALLIISLIPSFLVADNEVEDIDAETYQVEVRAESGGTANRLDITYEGLVPCGRCLISNLQYSEFLDSVNDCPSGTTYIPCDFCHLFILFDRIVSFVLGSLIPPIAMIVIVGSGLTLILSAGNPDKITKGKNILIYAAIGLFLAYASWAIVTLIVSSFMNWDVEWGRDGIQIQHMCNLELDEINIEVD